ncbi:MAG: hypothetical protein PHF57_05445 [Methanoregula sp.]|nr:hypothetical protein [Methanoregula sp.]
MIYTVSSIETLVRYDLNQSGTTEISSAEVLRAVNDGQMFVATRGLSIEKEAVKVTTSGRNVIKHDGIRVNYIELIGTDEYRYFIDDDCVWTDDDVTWYNTAAATSYNIGLQCILPTNIGYVALRGTQPQKWFNWGKYVVIEPVPDDMYCMKLYCADYPATLVDTWEELEVPKEFQPSVIDFVKSVLCIKLKRYTEVAAYYNKSIAGIQKAKAEYIRKIPDPRSAREVPEVIKNV